jgi:hypothetical protein
MPDLSNLTTAQFAAVLFIVALADVITGVVGALRGHTFTLDSLLDFLYTHGVQKILPMAGLFAVGQVAAVPVLCYAAAASLAVYVVTTFAAAWDNVRPTAAAAPAPSPAAKPGA